MLFYNKITKIIIYNCLKISSMHHIVISQLHLLALKTAISNSCNICVFEDVAVMLSSYHILSTILSWTSLISSVQHASNLVDFFSHLGKAKCLEYMLKREDFFMIKTRGPTLSIHDVLICHDLCARYLTCKSCQDHNCFPGLLFFIYTFQLFLCLLIFCNSPVFSFVQINSNMNLKSVLNSHVFLHFNAVWSLFSAC